MPHNLDDLITEVQKTFKYMDREGKRDCLFKAAMLKEATLEEAVFDVVRQQFSMFAAAYGRRVKIER